MFKIFDMVRFRYYILKNINRLLRIYKTLFFVVFLVICERTYIYIIGYFCLFSLIV